MRLVTRGRLAIVAGCIASSAPSAAAQRAAEPCRPPALDAGDGRDVGFDPLVEHDPDLATWIGRTAYLGSAIVGTELASVGDPLAICAIDGRTARVVTHAGKFVAVTIDELSRLPLGFRIAAPGAAVAVVRELFADAYRAGVAIYAVQAAVGFDVPGDDSAAGRRDATSERVAALHHHLAATRALRTRSRAGADAATRERFERAERCIATLDELRRAGAELHQIAVDRRTMPWRRGLEPMRRAAEADRRELAALDRRETATRAAIDRGAAPAECAGVAASLHADARRELVRAAR